MIRTIDQRIRRFVGQMRFAFRGKGEQVNTSAPVMLGDAEGLAGEKIRAAEMMQHFGFTSSPPAGFMYVAVPVGGKTAHSIIVATEHTGFRVKGLKSGEVAVYDNDGKSILLGADGIVIDGGNKPIKVMNTPEVTLDTPTTNVTGDLNIAGLLTGTGGFDISGGAGKTVKIAGDVDIQGGIKNNGHDIGSGHKHTNVQSGSSQSGGTV